MVNCESNIVMMTDWKDRSREQTSFLEIQQIKLL